MEQTFESTNRPRKLIGVDVGGTFTDVVLFDAVDGSTTIQKRATGVDAAATVVASILDVLEETGADVADVGLLIHGTTVATNALLEFDGAECGMLTTEGFRDVIHIGRHQRPQNYSIRQDIPWQTRPLVRRWHRMSIPERIAPPDGAVVVPLDEAAVRVAAERLKARGIEAIAICFLFSYLDGTHERRAAEIVSDVMPGAFVCTSHEIVPQFREFERFTTTAKSAFVGPAVRDYIHRLDDEVRAAGVGSPLHVMQSNGGTATVESATSHPATLLLSGPVGGVMGGIWTADRGERPLATLDVGGTSADIGIVTEDGLVEARSRDTWIAGYPVMVPMIDIETIGAGGGSIAYVDRAGALHVGPRSAGAQPGPAAYGRGGSEPTLTDANVVLGRLPTSLAGGLELNQARAATAIATLVPVLGMDVVDVAAGIVRIVNERMAAALRAKTIERGLDARELLLCAFGGAGPLQAAELGRILGIPEVLIPPHPGVTSAAGLLTSDLRYDVSRSYLVPLSDAEPDTVEALYREQEAGLRDRLERDGCQPGEVTVERAADLRYRGQGYELKVGVPDRDLDEAALAKLAARFHEDHRTEFGHHFPDLEIELANVRVTAVGALPHVRQVRVEGLTFADARRGTTGVAFDVDGKVETVSAGIYDRASLPIDDELAGPAIVTQEDSTTLIPPGCRARRDAVDNLVIGVGA